MCVLFSLRSSKLGDNSFIYPTYFHFFPSSQHVILFLFYLYAFFFFLKNIREPIVNLIKLMLFQTFSTLALGALYAASGAVAASSSSATKLPAIEVAGNKFFYSNNGSQFYIKGVAYQADTANSSSDDSIDDPLADYSKCSRDIPYLQKLQTNVVRVYAVNTTLDHSQCMEALADAGIYVIADLSTPADSVNRNDPTWDIALY